MRKTTALITALALALLLFTGSYALAATVSDGVYAGEAMGNNDLVKVNVTFKDGKIEQIESEHAETAGLGDVAIDKLSAAIIEGQSVAVDAVAGATNTSFALINAVGAAIAAAGGSIDDFMAVGDAAAATPAEDLSCDVVIVGAGGAGLVAALKAVEDGAQSVIVVEKMAVSGGNTVRSTGGMNAAATVDQRPMDFTESAGVEKTLAGAKGNYGEALADLIATVEGQWTDYQQKPEGYFDTPELFMLDTLIGGKNINDRALVETMARESSPSIDWLHSIGADLGSVGFAGGAAVKRIHRPVDEEGKALSVGSYLVPVFTKLCEQNDAITLLYETRATEILMADGAAAGIRCEGKGGAFDIAAKAVIMASGGFGANEEMYVKYRPELKGFVTTNAPGATGDGILMGEAIGAATVDMEQIQIHPTVEQNTSSLITEGVRGDGAILVNQEGVRFIDEVATRDVVSAAVIAQSDNYAYLIVDQKMVDASGVIAGYIKSGFTTTGETYEALAETVGIDGAVLAGTMADWNEKAKAGSDPDFNRTSFTEPLDTAPFYAIKIAPGVHHTMGGLKIDTATQVISTENVAIPGLFAAGEVTGGVHGANRLGGNAVADIVVFGRIAGASAAAYIALIGEVSQAA